MGTSLVKSPQTMKSVLFLVVAVLCSTASAFVAAPVAARQQVATSRVNGVQMFFNLPFGKKDEKPKGKVVSTKKVAAKKTGFTPIEKSGTSESWQAGSFGYGVPGTPSAGLSATYKVREGRGNF